MSSSLALSRRSFVCGGVVALSAAFAPPRTALAEDDDAGGRCTWGGWTTGSPAMRKAVADLVIANRYLAHENITDAYGHVSARHPEKNDRYLISRSLSPALVTPSDIMELHLDGTSVSRDDRSSYVERPIHGAIYEARPEINAVIHAHTEAVLPFTVSSVPLRVVTHTAGIIGDIVPVWDIHAKFGDTNLLVDDLAKGRDLAKTLGRNNVVLMRGHGFAGVGRDMIEAVRIALYLKVNAEVLLEALRLGKVTYLTPGEIRALKDVGTATPGLARGWELWARQAGCLDLLTLG